MSTWLIPCSCKVFRIHDYFMSNSIVDWKQSHYKFNVGDIIYIYCSHPEMSIRYKLIVVETDIEFNDSIKDEEYWADYHISQSVAKQNKYVRLELIDRVNSAELDLSALKDNGLKTAPQGPCRIGGNVLSYIESIFK